MARARLRPEETAAAMTFEVALKMRHLDELQARIARGEIVSRQEKEARYFPTATDHAAVVGWLRQMGLRVTRTDDNRLAVFGRGSVAAVARAFGVTFARVATDQGEFTSAITAPSLPAGIAAVVAGVHGLQPHIRPHVLGLPRVLSPNISTTPPYYPSQIAHIYDADSLSLTGAGQTIAIYAFATPLASDLTTFWTTVGDPQTYSSIQVVNVNGGPVNPTSGYLEEVTLDSEWASALAPGATIRIYAADENDPANNDEIFQQVYADLPSQASMHVLSVSIGGNELEVERDYLVIEAQYLANIASSGVSILVASGDNGAYANSDGILQATYPTSDPSVTGVGGTTVLLNSNGDLSSEKAWSGSGGGASVVFARPSWQVGTGVPTGSMRLVPDVAAAANPNDGALLVYAGAQSMIGGTSWAAPTWAAFCAMLNQGRSGQGLGPVGFLNPRLYALNGTSAIRDITSGSNGYYQAGTGYDLCTGLGVPDMMVLANASLTPTASPAVVGQLGNRTTVAGQPATFLIDGFGAPTLSYRWQRLPAGGSIWANLSDNATYSGSTTSMLVVSATTLAMNGDQFQCVLSNSLGSATSTPPAVLTVNTSGVTTLAGWPGSAGSADGTGWAARFRYPGGVRTDSSGTIYVADSTNNTIRKITPSGVVTTLAGLPYKSGTTNGSTAVALFNGIGGVAPDAFGNVYVADSGNFAIRKISGGVVSTLAGTPGTYGSNNGTGTQATFYDPQNLAVDGAGNVVVADGQGNTIRKVTPSGVVTTVAGSGRAGSLNGTGTAAQFRDPTGVVVDASGNIYVADAGNDLIRKITPAGVVTTLAGTAGRAGSTDGAGGLFNGPAGVAVDASGNVYVADALNDTIRKVTPAGVVSTLAGAAGIKENLDGLGSAARFWTPGDVAIDSAGVLTIADTYNMTIRRFVPGALSAPSITAAPQAQAVPAGGSATFSVTATGTGPFSYQWNLNGIPIPGATGSTLTLANVATTQAAAYTVTVTNPVGSVTSAGAALTVNYAARLDNLSARAGVGTSGSILIAGFGVSGAGSKQVMLRAVGPGLTSTFGLTGVLAAPQLTLYDSVISTDPQVIATDAGWGNSPVAGPSTLSTNPRMAGSALMLTLGAFALVSGSADSAMVVSAPIGSYTAQVEGTGSATGIALAEIYDADAGTPPARLINISARASVGTGGSILIGGFTITGSTSETVLIRGVGPGLNSTFGLTGVLATPQLTLYDSVVQTNPQVIATDTAWGSAPVAGPSTVQAGILSATAPVMTTVGAFSLVTGSADSAMLVTLPPGNYTVQLSGISGATGIALVEIYEVP